MVIVWKVCLLRTLLFCVNCDAGTHNGMNPTGGSLEKRIQSKDPLFDATVIFRFSASFQWCNSSLVT